MTDSEARGLVLRKIYDLRDARTIFLSSLSELGFDNNALDRFLTQLAEDNLIGYKPIRNYLGLGNAMITITVRGADAIEHPETAPSTVRIDQSINVHGSQNIQIGDRNVQSITIDVEKFSAAIDGSTATVEEKVAAKSLLKRLSESKLLLGILKSWFSGTPPTT